jgi:hypothetical protein
MEQRQAVGAVLLVCVLVFASYIAYSWVSEEDTGDMDDNGDMDNGGGDDDGGDDEPNGNTNGGSGNDGPTLSVVAHLSADKDNVTVYENVTFDASASTSDFGGNLSYWWHFNEETWGVPDMVTTEPVVVHAFSKPGVFDVMLIVEDDTAPDKTDMAFVDITVREGDLPEYVFLYDDQPGSLGPLPHQFFEEAWDLPAEVERVRATITWNASGWELMALMGPYTDLPDTGNTSDTGNLTVEVSSSSEPFPEEEWVLRVLNIDGPVPISELDETLDIHFSIVVYFKQGDDFIGPPG